MSTPLGDFGAPPDAMAWCALFLAAAVLAANHPALARRLQRVPDHVLVAAFSIFAAGVSLAYVAVYLRGGPRIIDATTYYLQARALSEGHVAFHVPSPTASFRGRFLLPSADGHSLAGIFPPGYPALLALGFLAGRPMLVGPLLAAFLVVATYALSMRLFAERRVALLAAALSATSGVLRYHTADTMSHGLAALLFVLTVYLAKGRTARSALLSGACLGWLVATRPVTGIVGLALCIVITGPTPRQLALLVAGASGPVLLFLVEQRLATSAWLTSSQTAYYALADGPPGCFHYGFGAGIGCVFEHGDFVRAHLSHGYGFVAAAGTTLRRLKMHLADAGNAEVFAPLLLYAFALARRQPRVRAPALAVVGVIAAYAPFYFDGNYPGGGARFFADVLPFEHLLLAFALSRLRLLRVAVPIALCGFALHTVHDHLRLAEREGGRPMFEPDVVQRAGVTHGLVFVATDHGFNLGYDPAVTSPRDGVVVARRRGDAHDAELWERFGRPPTFDYEMSLAPHAPEPRIVPVTPQHASIPRFEAEAEWPPLAVRGGFTEPTFPPCASAHRALALNPSPGQTLRVRLGLPGVSPGKYRISSGWVTPASGSGSTLVTLAGIPFRVDRAAPGSPCQTVIGPRVEISQADDFIELSATSPEVLDYLELTPVATPGGAH